MLRTAFARRGVAALATTAVAALAITGCSSPAGTGTTGDDEKVTLEYGVWDQKQEVAMTAIADAFTEEHPNVTIKIVTTPYKEYFTKLQTSVSGGSAPDVFWMNGPNFLFASSSRSPCRYCLRASSSSR